MRDHRPSYPYNVRTGDVKFSPDQAEIACTTYSKEGGASA